jgi:hypothetical protein
MISKHDLDLPAEMGTLSPQVHADLILIRGWQALRDTEMAELFGKDAGNTLLLQELVVFCLTEFGHGVRWSIRAFQDHCGHLASRETIRAAIMRLVDRGLFLVGAVPEDKRVTLVCPTRRLVEWAGETIPRMEDAMVKFFIDRSGVPS